MEYLESEASCLLFVVSIAGFSFPAVHWYFKLLKCTKEGYSLCSPDEVISVPLTDKVV